MRRVSVRRWAPGDVTIQDTTRDFTSETDALNIRRREGGLVEILDGNILLAAYANLPIEILNGDSEEAPPGS